MIILVLLALKISFTLSVVFKIIESLPGRSEEILKSFKLGFRPNLWPKMNPFYVIKWSITAKFLKHLFWNEIHFKTLNFPNVSVLILWKDLLYSIFCLLRNSFNKLLVSSVILFSSSLASCFLFLLLSTVAFSRLLCFLHFVKINLYVKLVVNHPEGIPVERKSEPNFDISFKLLERLVY